LYFDTLPCSDALLIVHIEKILGLVPDDLLAELALETGVDYYSKKLQGRVLFRLLMYCLLTQKQSSLRSVTSTYESAVFTMFNEHSHCLQLH
jgi:hypothetical protein